MNDHAPVLAPAPSRPPTLRDIAGETGFHVTTVSLALRGHTSIPEATREKIRTVATRLGYARDSVFCALTRFRQQGRICGPKPGIAYVENFGASSGVRRPAPLQAMLDGAIRQSRALGYDLETLAVGEDDHDSRSLSAVLREKQISGVILGAFVPGCADTALNWDELAVAKIHSRHIDPDTTTIGHDPLRDVRLAWRRLRALGYARIGLVVGRADEDACGHRHTAGFLMEEASLPPEERIPPLLYPYRTDERALGGLMARWVRRHRLDVLLTNHPDPTRLLSREGLRVPRDVACAGLCVAPGPARLAGIHPRFDLVGERAVSIVVAKLKSSERGLPDFPSSIHVQSSWQDGASAPGRQARP
ncbi:MAG: LacI family transcriptional regulator [Opitutaceae bacterium]|nr:LacI family transcriptional regulator [Opitutaceae bacterium]